MPKHLNYKAHKMVIRQLHSSNAEHPGFSPHASPNAFQFQAVIGVGHETDLTSFLLALKSYKATPRFKIYDSISPIENQTNFTLDSQALHSPLSIISGRSAFQLVCSIQSPSVRLNTYSNADQRKMESQQLAYRSVRILKKTNSFVFHYHFCRGETTQNV